MRQLKLHISTSCSSSQSTWFLVLAVHCIYGQKALCIYIAIYHYCKCSIARTILKSIRKGCSAFMCCLTCQHSWVQTDRTAAGEISPLIASHCNKNSWLLITHVLTDRSNTHQHVHTYTHSLTQAHKHSNPDVCLYRHPLSLRPLINLSCFQLSFFFLLTSNFLFSLCCTFPFHRSVLSITFICL